MTDYTELIRQLKTYEDGYGLYEDAADAIEELQQIADHYEHTAKDYWKEACEYKAQLPKRGEWILENYCWHCSVCGENPTRGMGYVQGKSELFRVCPNCGANMEVQDDKA